MKELSIIIVNYNVKHFLRACLASVLKAVHNINAEIIVVDNDSIDDSVEMVKAEFPQVKVIVNNENVGFSKANNQGILASSGEYVLILNPDTLVSENTFVNCLAEIKSENNIGAIGVKMYDGSGAFLPESKRGNPTLWSSFCKFSGLWQFFPKSKLFNSYYQGHLDNENDHNVPVLTGAFMFMRRSVLDIIGLLDERFFMYGEDIDLSFRIIDAGYKNRYLSNSSIVHFKGESTKKGSFTYTKHFYNAMRLFNEKHSSGGFLFNSLINILILILGVFSFLKALVIKLLPPIYDFLIVIAIYVLAAKFWGHFYFGNIAYYNYLSFYFLITGFASIYILGFFLMGKYPKNENIVKTISAWIVTTLAIVLTYSFLPESMRFSRALIIIAAVGIIPFSLLGILLYQRIITGKWRGLKEAQTKIIVIGSNNSIQQFKHAFESNPQLDIVSAIELSDQKMNSKEQLIIDIKKAISILNANEIFFCTKDISNNEIFNVMNHFGAQIKYRIGNLEEGSIESSSKNTTGNWKATSLTLNLSQSEIRKQKRIFDIVSGIIFLILFPILFIFSPNRKTLAVNIFPVIFGFKTWIGYASETVNPNLPKLKTSIFSNFISSDNEFYTTVNTDEIDSNYATNYTVLTDFNILVNKLFSV